MPSFDNGHIYTISEENKDLFLDQSFHNASILKEIEEKGPTFEVLETQEDCDGRSAIRVRFIESGKISWDGFYITAAEREFFNDITNSDRFWKYGSVYKCTDLRGLGRSAINKHFIDAVGDRSFKINKMMNDFERTHSIGYVTLDGQLKEMKITFTPGERVYFKHVQGAPEPTEREIDKVLALEEEQYPTYTIDDMAKEINELKVEEKSFMNIEGAINFRVENEEDRSRAIEWLQKMKWKN